jgi:hypothetical protein
MSASGDGGGHITALHIDMPMTRDIGFDAV